MEYSAVRHLADKRDCFALEKGKFLFRIRTKKDDIEEVVLHSRDKYIPIDWYDSRVECRMEKVASDFHFDYFEVVMEMDLICLRYFFSLTDKTGMTCYFGNGEFYDEPIDNTQFMFNCPQNLREEECFDIPKANNLKKQGGFIPGFRPGKPTVDFIKKVLNKITLFGAIYLGIVAIAPLIVGKIIGNNSIAIGGTSVIIVVGVALETVKALEAQMLMRHYKGFLD